MDLGEGVSGNEAKKSPKSLEKVCRGLPAPGPQKSENCLQKGPRSQRKSLQMGFWRLFGPFSRIFFDFWGFGAGRLFRDFFQTFWLRAPRLPLPGPRNLKTCTELRSTISRHLLPPVSRWGENMQWIHTGDPVEIVGLTTERGVSGTRKAPIPPREKGGRRQHKMVTAIWGMFDSP